MVSLFDYPGYPLYFQEPRRRSPFDYYSCNEADPLFTDGVFTYRPRRRHQSATSCRRTPSTAYRMLSPQYSEEQELEELLKDFRAKAGQRKTANRPNRGPAQSRTVHEEEEQNTPTAEIAAESAEEKQIAPIMEHEADSKKKESVAQMDVDAECSAEDTASLTSSSSSSACSDGSSTSGSSSDSSESESETGDGSDVDEETENVESQSSSAPEDDQSAPASEDDQSTVLKKGDKVLYKRRDGQLVSADIVSVDHGLIPPSYVIRVDGSEKETERTRLIVPVVAATA